MKHLWFRAWAREHSTRPRRWAGRVTRPLNFTVMRPPPGSGRPWRDFHYPVRAHQIATTSGTSPDGGEARDGSRP